MKKLFVISSIVLLTSCSVSQNQKINIAKASFYIGLIGLVLILDNNEVQVNTGKNF